MHKVLVLGAGKIGSLVGILLSSSKKYHVFLADVDVHAPHLTHLASQSSKLTLVTLDAKDSDSITHFIQQHKIEAIASALPFFCNPLIVKIAKETNIHYFDFTEDVKTASIVQAVSQDASKAFVTQCGLAPGFINIIAHELMQHFPKLNTVKLRVGALPMNISNALQYSLTWSTDGLINEYCNPCYAVENREEVKLPPLTGLEEIQIDGLTYEAFNTSGGVGTLVQTYAKKVNYLSYKTIRYPGHCAKIRFFIKRS